MGIKVQEHPEGFTVNLGRGRFVKTGHGLRCLVRIWKTKKGAEAFIKKNYKV